MVEQRIEIFRELRMIEQIEVLHFCQIHLHANGVSSKLSEINFILMQINYNIYKRRRINRYYYIYVLILPTGAIYDYS